MKRIAFIASIALALTGFLALPAEATGTPVNLIASATGVTPAGTVATQIAGPANFVAVSNTFAAGLAAKPVYFTLSGGVTTTATSSGTIAAGATVGIATTTPGTITLQGYAITNGAAATSPTDVIVITVISSLPGTAYASSTIFAAASTAQPTPATDAAFSVSAPSGAANVANFTVTEVDSGGIALQAASAKPITVIATNALISSPNLTASPSGNSTYMTGIPVNPTTDFVISGIPGFGGTATVAISVNSVLVKTYSIKFTGIASRIVLTPINSVVGVGAASALLPSSFNPIGITANTNALEVQEFDAQGNLLALTPANISISSSAPTIASAGSFDAAGIYTLGDIPGGTATTTSAMGVSINGLSVGTTNFTATDTALGLSSSSVPIRVSSGKPTSAVITTNAPNYALGALGTMSTLVSDAAGPLPAGTYIVFASQSVSSTALSTGSAQLPGAPANISGPPAIKQGEVVVNNQGLYTFSFNAPIVSAEVTVNGTPANSSITITPATFTVGAGASGPAVASTDATNESSDASTAAVEVQSLTDGQANTADQAVATVNTNATGVQALIITFNASVTSVTKLLASNAAKLAKIRAKAAKK